MLNAAAVREVIVDMCGREKELQKTKSVFMYVGDDFMVILSNQDVQVALGKFWGLHLVFLSPMRDKQNEYR